MKKKLNIEGVSNELRGGSAFFPSYTKQQSSQRKELEIPQTGAEKPVPLPAKEPTRQLPNDTVIPRHHDTMVSRHHDTMNLPLNDILETIRKSVKHIGKEAATHRFTIDEKNELADIEYTYKRQGIKTSENEITRIAINYFVEDYKKHGEESLLAQILRRINS